MNGANSAGVRETRLVHEVQGRATSLLAEVLALPTVPIAAGALRDFVVEMLEHHHTCEDQHLGPLILAHAPPIEQPLRALTGEHDDLQAQLDRLKLQAIDRGRPDTAAAVAAAAVRERVHEHLAHEEPVLFPALERHVPDNDWDSFSIRAVASAPQTGVPFLLALIDEVGPPADAELIFRHVPDEARSMIPARRAAGEDAIADLRSRIGAYRGGPR
ncbi:MAG TPA: hemerythrin domain-containing protein [Ilumatobacter sp.]